MFKPLLRTIPSLSGNFKLACKVTDVDIDKNDKNIYHAYVRKAALQPLKQSMYNRDIEVDLQSGMYEFDIPRYYDKYDDVFFLTQFDIQKKDFMQPKLDSDPIYVRNKPFEFGCERISYFANGYQMAFYAPIYVDSVDDLPEEIEIGVSFNAFITKKIKIKIADDDRRNLLGQYLTRYCKKIDKHMIFWNDSLQKFVYSGVNVVTGGFLTVADSTIQFVKDQLLPINDLDKKICQAYQGNKMVAKQIIPLCFLINPEQVLTPMERRQYKFLKIQSVSARWLTNDKQHALCDLSTNYDEWMMPSGANAMLDDSNTGSFKEPRMDVYKYDNKLAPYYCRWQMMLDFDGPDAPINLSPMFGQDDYTSGLPTQSNLVDCYIQISGVNSGYVDEQSPEYVQNMSNHADDWITYVDKLDPTMLSHEDWWHDVIGNYSVINGVMYNLNALMTNFGQKQIDRFGIFIKPDIALISDDTQNIIKCKNAYTWSTENKNMYVNIDALISTSSQNYINPLITASSLMNCLHETDVIFKKSDLANRDTVKYMLKNNVKNDFISIADFKKMLTGLYQLSPKKTNKGYEWKIIIHDIIANIVDVALDPGDTQTSLPDVIVGKKKIVGLSSISSVEWWLEDESKLDDVYMKLPYTDSIVQLRVYSQSRNQLDAYSGMIDFYLECDMISVESLSQLLYNAAMSETIYPTIMALQELDATYGRNMTLELQRAMNHVIDSCRKYEYDINSLEGVFNEKRENGKHVYVDALKSMTNEVKELRRFKRYYARIMNQYQLENFFSISFASKIHNFFALSPYIKESNDDVQIRFKHWKLENPILTTDDDWTKYVDIDGVVHDKVKSIPLVDGLFIGRYEGQSHDIKLCKEIIAKPMSWREINRILTMDSTYCMYVEDDMDDDKFETLMTDAESLKEMNHRRRKRVLKPIFEDIYHTEDETNYQKSLITSGNLCIEHDGVIDDISQTSKFSSSHLRYYKDVNDKYLHMFECTPDNLCYIITGNLCTSQEHENMTEFEFALWLISLAYNVEVSNIDIMKFKLGRMVDDTRIWEIRLGDMKREVNKLCKSLNSCPGLMSKQISWEDLSRQLIDKNSKKHLDLYSSYQAESTVDEMLEKCRDHFLEVIIGYVKPESMRMLLKDKSANTVRKVVDWIYEDDWDKMKILIQWGGLSLYEMYSQNQLNFLTPDESEWPGLQVVSATDDGMMKFAICEQDGLTYAMVIMSKYFDNTSNTYNIKNGRYFSYIDEIHLNYNTFGVFFNKLLPCMNQSLFDIFISKMKSLGIGSFVKYPSEFDVMQQIMSSPSTDTDFSYQCDSFTMPMGSTTYEIAEMATPITWKIYRHLNYMRPIMLPAYKLAIYEAKTKQSKIDFGDDNIIKREVTIDKDPGIIVFEDHISNHVLDGDDKLYIYHEMETKHFNASSIYYLEPEFEVQITTPMPYEKLLELETEEESFEKFKKYVRKYRKPLHFSESQLLFLFSRYKVDYESNPVRLSMLADKKLYLLKIKYTLR